MCRPARLARAHIIHHTHLPCTSPAHATANSRLCAHQVTATTVWRAPERGRAIGHVALLVPCDHRRVPASSPGSEDHPDRQERQRAPRRARPRPTHARPYPSPVALPDCALCAAGTGAAASIASVASANCAVAIVAAAAAVSAAAAAGSTSSTTPSPTPSAVAAPPPPFLSPGRTLAAAAPPRSGGLRRTAPSCVGPRRAASSRVAHQGAPRRAAPHRAALCEAAPHRHAGPTDGSWCGFCSRMCLCAACGGRCVCLSVISVKSVSRLCH